MVTIILAEMDIGAAADGLRQVDSATFDVNKEASELVVAYLGVVRFGPGRSSAEVTSFHDTNRTLCSQTPRTKETKRGDV